MERSDSMKKFDYYLFYKDTWYCLTTRDNLLVHRSSSFLGMHTYIREHALNFSRIRLKAMNLNDFFKDWVTFEDRGERI